MIMAGSNNFLIHSDSDWEKARTRSQSPDIMKYYLERCDLVKHVDDNIENFHPNKISGIMTKVDDDYVQKNWNMVGYKLTTDVKTNSTFMSTLPSSHTILVNREKSLDDIEDINDNSCWISKKSSASSAVQSISIKKRKIEGITLDPKTNRIGYTPLHVMNKTHKKQKQPKIFEMMKN